MHVISVQDYLELINTTLKEVVSGDLVVEGEVSDYRLSQNKWVSFDLKDEKGQAVLKCFATIWQLRTPLEDGMKIQVKGYPKIYERFGTFKLNVQEVELVGEGALRRAYEMLKKQFEKEGLFDHSHKRTLPRFIKKIGLITSREAAAYTDFLRILNNRWGGVDVVHAHVHVQGKHAAIEIMEALAEFNELSEKDRPDVIVLTRGGGGLEDLHAFNDEQVARMVFQSSIPVVVGVGHERDESLCDFVCDVRASTPSNAAERIVPNREEVLYEIETMLAHMDGKITDQVREVRFSLDQFSSTVELFVQRQREVCSLLSESFYRSVDQWLPELSKRIESALRILRQVDPQTILSRGFSLVRTDGKLVKNASDLDKGGQINVQLAAGSLDAEVIEIYYGN